MSQANENKAEAAEARTQQTRGFMQQVRVAARRKYTPEEKVRIVLEGFRREVAVNELCRREGIKPGAYYAWTKDFMEATRVKVVFACRCYKLLVAYGFHEDILGDMTGDSNQDSYEDASAEARLVEIVPTSTILVWSHHSKLVCSVRDVVKNWRGKYQRQAKGNLYRQLGLSYQPKG